MEVVAPGPIAEDLELVARSDTWLHLKATVREKHVGYWEINIGRETVAPDFDMFVVRVLASTPVDVDLRFAFNAVEDDLVEGTQALQHPVRIESECPLLLPIGEMRYFQRINVTSYHR